MYLCVFITARIKRSAVCVFVHTITRSAGHMECTVQPERGRPAGEGEAAEFLKRRTFSSQRWRWHTFSGVQTHVEEGWALKHLVQFSHRVGFITSESRLGFRLIRAKWTIESRSGPRFPAGHKVTLSSMEPYVSQMLPASVPFKETIRHNYRNI